MNRKKHILFVLLITVLLISACQAGPTPTSTALPPVTLIVEPTFVPSGEGPLTEQDVPRVSLEEANAARESGAAVVVDVRNPDAFEASHVAGAINIPLIDIERNPTVLNLAKDQWIITYCT
jgi:3-mercaptopyruvate sulfurtransferase SseA